MYIVTRCTQGLDVRVVNKIGNELDLQTVGQVAEKMTSAHYLKSRRDMNTFNKNEIEKVLVGLFGRYFEIGRSKLTKDARLFDNKTNR